MFYVVLIMRVWKECGLCVQVVVIVCVSWDGECSGGGDCEYVVFHVVVIA